MSKLYKWNIFLDKLKYFYYLKVTIIIIFFKDKVENSFLFFNALGMSD